MDRTAFNPKIAAGFANTTTTHDSASDDEDDGEDYEYDPEITLGSIDKSKTINLSIRANYTKWAPREAFRELVQNWRDGIIRAFGLAERDFCVVREEKTSGRSTEIVYKVLRIGGGDDDKKEWLGYIRFKALDGEGTIDITNRSATLQPWHLDLGGTSKAGDPNQAGAHGEGLKIALLVLMRGRQNHSVRCRSGGFAWKFNFTTRGRLVARLRRMKPEAIHKAQDQARRLSERTLLPFAADPVSDVQFVIGEAQAGRNEQGGKVRRRQVKREDFDAWTKAVLFLQDGRNGAIISTEHGDLLTDPQLCGHIYLKGLLLRASTPTRSASITTRPLKFGYNFASGTTNRERQSVSGAGEEANAILAIWSSVLATRPEMAPELDAMLNTTEPRYADISGAETDMNLATACRLKEYLFGSQFAGKWYYCSEDKKKNPRLGHIIQGLGCEGAELADAYWAILRRHKLIRTAEEEERRRFTAAPPVTVAGLESAFATSVRRFLCACVRACPKTNGMAIDFVQAGQLHLQLFYSKEERLFRVHERWLSVGGAIAELGLPEDLLEADVVFHAVKRLFADALEQMPPEVFAEEDNARTGEWRRKWEVSRAELRLLNYLHMGELRINPATKPHGVRLTWDLDSRQDFDTSVEIQCHSASRCSHLRDGLLTAEEARADKMACINMAVRDGNEDESEQTVGNDVIANRRLPPCRVYRCDESRGEHSEHDLEKGEKYFFLLVTPEDPDSFVGVSNVASAIPRRPPPVVAAASAGSFTLGPRLRTLDVFRIDRERWYEAKSSENVQAVIGILAGEKLLSEETRKRPRLD